MMKKLSNKGFAISTVIYGLSIMGVLIISILMGILSTTRKNTKELANSIEEELNRFSKTNYTFRYKNNEPAQEYVVPDGQSGYYKIELFGASGGNGGGLGAYTSGVIKLMEKEKLYFYVGKKGSSGRGGGSTDVRTDGGGYTMPPSYKNRIMAAAGGGTDPSADGGTMYGYSLSMKSNGGEIDAKDNGDFNLLNGTTLIGTTNSFKLSSVSYSVDGNSPKGHNLGGGGGYNQSKNSTVGGTSYISGYAGQHVTNDEYFYDGMMYPGVNSGDGFAKIEKVASINEENSTLKRKNQKMNKVVKIRDCLSTSNTNNITWKKLEAIENGKNVVTTYYDASKPSYACREYNLVKSSSLDEIAVWHNAGVDYRNHTIEVQHNNGEWEFIKGVGNSTDLSETETVTGFRISAYQPDYTLQLPDSGNYYIVPVLSENKCLTASDVEDLNNFYTKLDYFNGSKRQIWSITLLPDNLKGNNSLKEYKITELAGYKSLRIIEDESMVGNKIGISKFNQITRDESLIWEVNPVGNGTYVVSSSDKNSREVTDPYYGTNVVSKNNEIIIGRNNINTTRFKLIALDY